MYFFNMKIIIYVFFITVPILGYSQFSDQIIITDDSPSTWSVFLADLDGDFDFDLLATDATLEGKISWFKNLDGQGTFGEEQIITLNLTETRFVTAADLDGDNDMDVLATSLFGDLVVWYENIDGLGTFGTQNVITTQVDLPLMAFVADLDDDDDLDVLTASKNDGKLAWYENEDGMGTFGAQQIIGSTQAAASIFVADLDGDGDGDVISDRSSNGFPCWYENLDGLGTFGAQQEISQDPSGSHYVIAEDLDGDNDMDIINLEFGGDTVSWFENMDGLGNFSTKKIITTDVSGPRLVVTADIDNDNDLDVIYNSQEGVTDNRVAWQENDGNGNFGPQQIITTNIVAARGLFSADVDNDSDMDVFYSSIGDNKIAWNENLTVLGLNNNLEQFVTITPNPTNGVLSIESESNIETIKVYNVLGKLVLEQSNPSNQIDISSLSNGLLFIQIETDEGSFVKKIIKE